MSDIVKTDLTAEDKEIAIDLAAQGVTITKIRKHLGLSAQCWSTALNKDGSFSSRFAHARQDGLEELADSLLTIPDEVQDVLKARLKSENIRWVLSKRKPLVYGDRIDLNVNQTIDIRTALSDAKDRIRDVTHSITQRLDSSILNNETDIESVDVPIATVDTTDEDIFK